jgi:MFS family permease
LDNHSLIRYAMISQLAAWTGAALFIPTIPLFLRHLHASDVEIGYYTAATLISLSFGPMLIGWLSDRLHVRDRLVVLCYALQAPIAYLMGETENLVLVCLLNIGLWTFGASSINLTRAIVALNFAREDRNRAFARLAVTSPIAFVIGGLAGGRIVEAMGYPGLFKIMSACWIVAMLSALGVRDRYVPPASSREEQGSISTPLILFCCAMFLQSLAFQWSEIGLPLRLKDLEYSLPFITSMYSVSSLVSIPFAILAGRYGGRIGNLNLLVGGLVMFSLTRFGLSALTSEYQIVGLQMITGIPAAFAHSIAAAVMAGLGPDRTVGRRMSLMMMSGGIGGALGGVAGGYLLESYGPVGLLLSSGIGLMCAAAFMRLFVVDPDQLGETEQ